MSNYKSLSHTKWECKYHSSTSGTACAGFRPTLLLTGEHSDVASPEMVERVCSLVPKADAMETAGAGHPVSIEQPDAFVEAVRSFFARV